MSLEKNYPYDITLMSSNDLSKYLKILEEELTIRLDCRRNLNSVTFHVCIGRALYELNSSSIYYKE